MRFKPVTVLDMPGTRASEAYQRYLALGVLGRNLQRLEPFS